MLAMDTPYLSLGYVLGCIDGAKPWVWGLFSRWLVGCCGCCWIVEASTVKFRFIRNVMGRFLKVAGGEWEWDSHNRRQRIWGPSMCTMS